ncbi:CapA family protein [Planosporangium flavigriseum]|nr:CapA family protein [Planosporangium flavigriseum]
MRGAGPADPASGSYRRSTPPVPPAVGRSADVNRASAAGRAPVGRPAAERPSRLASIVTAEPPRRPSSAVRTNLLAVGLVGLIVVGLATSGTALALRGSESGAGASRWSAPVVTPAAPGSDAASSPAVAPVVGTGDATVSLSATGDIIMGAAPANLPPRGAGDFFADVKGALRADVQMGNLEQPLTNDTGVTKCPPSAAPSPGAVPSTPPSAPPKPTCFAFRSPPAYAEVLRDAGFRVLNLANNHAYDFGAEGNRQTRSALEAAGLAHTGAPGQITVVETKGIKIAVVGFSSYPWSASLVDVSAAAALVKRAKARADLAVVHMHAGAEGADKTHVRPGTEMFLGENRGDPLKFAHAVVDAGADLVIGHGPHVMRAMEFYRGRLIAYSLGNFAGYRALNYNGVPGVGGVLKVTLRKDGSYVDGSLVPTRMVAPGLPAMDPAKQALSLIRGLSDTDLPASGVRIGDNGAITSRT